MYEHYLFGEFVKSKEPLSSQDLEDIFASADRASGKIQELPLDSILNVLDRVSVNWLDEEYHLRKTALEKMPGIVGYSDRMTQLAIESLFTNLHRENLFKLIRSNLGRPSFLDRFEYIPSFDGYLKAQPLGTILHVSPGNVFVGGIDSLMNGFITKNVNLLKISRQDPLFPFLFAQSLKEVDEREIICNSFAILDFSSKDEKIEEEMKKRCDGIVVIGGEAAVKSYRKDLPLGTRLVEYGPRYSFSIITADGFKTTRSEEVYEKCAHDVVIWEQRACSSPQVIYVEKSVVEEFLEHFPRYLEIENQKYPQENLSIDEKVEILKAREMARFHEALGEAVLHHSPRSTNWTVIYEESPDFRISPLNRTIYVKPFTSWAEIMSQAMKISAYLQSVGILGTAEQIKTLSKALARLGISRVTSIGTMGKVKVGAPHDFEFPLRKMIKWVSIDWVSRKFDLGDRIAPAKTHVPTMEKLREIVRFARTHSRFYRNHLRDVDPAKIKTYRDFEKTPFLDKKHIYQNTPPADDSMLTAPLTRAYVFASGGSTGKPKFNFYSFTELDEVASILADIYQVAGITRDDVVANLFMAGFLWTSFIVVNQAIEKIGCVSLPIAGNADLDLIIQYMQMFRPNVVLGLPSMIIQLAEEIGRRKLDLKIEKILYGGEHFSDEALKFLKTEVGAKLIHSAGYASVDAGPIGYQCPENSGGVHHLLSEYTFLEIIDPDSGKPVEKGEAGEIVVTNFNRKLMPVVRYRTGDMGRFLSRSCTCSHNTPLFELLGRSDDVLRIAAMSIYPAMISESIAKVEQLSSLFQVIGEYAGVKEKVTIKVEAREKSEDYSSIADSFRKILLEQNPELNLVLKEKWMEGLSIEIVPPKSLPRNPRTGKIRQVIDKRKRGVQNAR